MRDTYPNAAIWLVGDTYPKRSDWCEQHTTLYANIKLLKKKNLKNDSHRLKSTKIREKVLFRLYDFLMEINWLILFVHKIYKTSESGREVLLFS